MNLQRAFFFFLFCFFTALGHTQVVVGDTSNTVEILPGTKKMNLKTLPDGTQVQILVGNVRMRQGTTLFSCDSCVLNDAAKTFLAFGNVNINEGDTSQVWSNNLRYLYDKKYAYLNGNVRLTDGHGNLTTNTLEYDVARKIGIYKNGGKVVNAKTTVTSQEAIYYTDIKDVYFKKIVEN